MTRGSSVRLLLAALLVLGAVACSGDDDGGSDDAPGGDGTTTTSEFTEEAQAEAELSAGCAADVPPPEGQTEETLTSSGEERTYRRMVPAGPADGGPMAVVLDFHGLGSNATEQEALSGMEDLGQQEDFVVLTPQGRGDGLTFWAYSDADNPDFGFVSDLIDTTANQLCIDLNRVFATGMSNGGLMSTGLACRMPEEIAAVSGVSGLAYFDDCDTSRPIAVQEIHGTGDDVLPYEGGLGDVLADRGIPDAGFPPIRESMDNWAAHDGCDPEPEEEVISEEVTRFEWPNCDDGAAVVHYRVEGGGHTWPGTPLLDTAAADNIERLGLTTDDIDASELAWEFFQAHPKPSD